MSDQPTTVRNAQTGFPHVCTCEPGDGLRCFGCFVRGYEGAI